MKKWLLKLAYWIINRYDKNRVVGRELKMTVENEVNFTSPSKVDQLEKFLNNFK